MKNSIFNTLEKLNLTSKKTKKLFNKGTRDMNDLNVWIDKISGVIYIDDFYTGDHSYIEGTYRSKNILSLDTGSPDFEQVTDAKRRFHSNLRFVAGKKVADFGCGNGDFLKLIQPYCKEVMGIEMQKDYYDSINSSGIKCYDSLNFIKNQSLDVVVSFHVLEHLPDPLDILTKIKEKIKKGGLLIIEVPHANDFLLTSTNNENFKKFTLWSQHLILHTRESLYKFLNYIGLKDIQIKGVQRYPLSNHLNWLINNKGGGHKTSLSFLDNETLYEAYSNSLSKINATDTLVAIGKI